MGGGIYKYGGIVSACVSQKKRVGLDYEMNNNNDAYQRAREKT